MTIFMRTVAFGLMTGVFSVAVTFLTVGFKYGTMDERLWVGCLFTVAAIVGAAIYRTNPESAWDLLALWRKILPVPDKTNPLPKG